MANSSPGSSPEIAAPLFENHARHSRTFTAAELLRPQDPDGAPWAVLADYGAATPEEVVRRTRQVIERHPDETEKRKLLAVTQALLRVRYNDPGLLGLLGGRQMMLESPLIAELAEEWHGAELRRQVSDARAEATVETKADDVLRILRVRFQQVQTDVEEALYAERDLDRLNLLMDAAAVCPNMAEFRARLWPN